MYVTRVAVILVHVDILALNVSSHETIFRGSYDEKKWVTCRLTSHIHNIVLLSEARVCGINYGCFGLCVVMTLRSTSHRLCATSVNILSSSLYSHYLFRPSRPSSGVHVIVTKESAAHRNALLPLLRNCVIS